MSLFPGVVLLDIALLYYKRATTIAMMHWHNGREDKLGRGPRTDESVMAGPGWGSRRAASL